MCQAVGETAYSRYPFQAGLPSLREAIAGWMQGPVRRHSGSFGRRYYLSLGQKKGLPTFRLHLLDDGDAAVIPDPGYQAYRR